MTTLFLKITNMSIIASWLIIIIIMLRIVLQKAPKWIFCLLWGIVAIRLVFPISFQSTLSVVSNPEPINPATFQLSQGTIAHSSDLTTNQEFPIFILVTLVSVIWLIGVIAILCYAIISYWRIKKRMHEAVLLKENIFICDSVKSPFILGIVKPKIYLSSSLGEKEMAYVIAHEKAHLRRKDHLWKPFGFLLLSVYWLNPLIWIAYSLFCKDIELACDEKVIKALNFSERKNYSEALLFCSLQKTNIIAYPLGFGEIGVKGRIRNVLNYKKPAFWIGIVAVIICIIVAVCLLTNSPDNVVENIENVSEKQSNYESSNTSRDSIKNGFSDLEEIELVVEDNWPTSISRVTSETTAKNLSFNIQIDNPMTIILSFVTEEGKISMEITDERGNKLFDETNIETGTFEVNIEEVGTYTVTIQANNHTGSFEIKSKK